MYMCKWSEDGQSWPLSGWPSRPRPGKVQLEETSLKTGNKMRHDAYSLDYNATKRMADENDRSFRGTFELRIVRWYRARLETQG